MADYKYDPMTRDRVIGANLNYETTSGAEAEMGRHLAATYGEFPAADGEHIGNRLWSEGARLSDTPEDLELAMRFCKESLAPMVAARKISKPAAELAESTSGVRVIWMHSTDLKTRKPIGVGVIPPWAAN